ATDAVARHLAPVLSERLGQRIIIENVSGAGGSLAVQRLMGLPADGSSLLLGTSNETVLIPSMNKSIGYQTADLQPIGKIGSTTMVLVGHDGLQGDTFEALAERMTRASHSIRIGHPGNNTFQHLLLKKMARQTAVEVVP